MANDKDRRQEPNAASAAAAGGAVGTSAAGHVQQQQQNQQHSVVVLVPPTAASCSSILPRWATLEFPLPIQSSSVLASTRRTTISSTTTKHDGEEAEKKEKDEQKRTVVLLSREEANLRTQTFHSVSFQLDDACQQAMERLYVGDAVDENNHNETHVASAATEENKNKTTTTIRRSIQQALQTLFQETAACAACSACSAFSTATTPSIDEKIKVVIPPRTPKNDDEDDTAAKDESSTRKRERLDTNGEEDHVAIVEDPQKRVRLGENEEEHHRQQQQQQQQQPANNCSRPHVELLRNRFLAAISTTTTTVMNKEEKNSLQSSSSRLVLLLPVLIMQAPYHAMDRFTWMQFLVEQGRQRPPTRSTLSSSSSSPPLPPPPPPAVVWLRPAAGLATYWPEEILRQLLLLLQSTANQYMSANNPQLAAQARLAWTACSHCPLTGRRRKRHAKSSSSSLVGRILQTWARHVEGLFSGIVVYVDLLDTTLVSSSSSNVNASVSTAASPSDHSSSSSSSSSLDWKDLLAWLSHQRAGHGLPVSCVLMVPASPTNGHHGSLLSFDSLSLQGIGAGMHVQQVVLPTTRHFLTTLQECFQEQQQQHHHDNNSRGDCRLLQLVQQIRTMTNNMNQHEHHDSDTLESSSLSSSIAAIPTLMDWKRCVAQILTRRSSFLPFWLLQQNQHQQQCDLKLHVSWFLRHDRGREFLLQYDDSNKNSTLTFEDVGISSCPSSNCIPRDNDGYNKNVQSLTQPPRLWQWLQRSRQWHLLVEMAWSIEQAAACSHTAGAVTTTAASPLLLLLPTSRVNPNEQNDQTLEYDSRRAILAILFRYRQEILQSQQCADKKDDKNIVSFLESRSADAVDKECYGQRLSRYLLGRPFANDENTRRRVLHQINQLIILVDQCTQVSQVHRLVVAPILRGWARHLEWLFSSASSSSSLKTLVQQAQPRRQTTAGLLAQSLGSTTTCLPISSLERLPGILYGLILHRVSIPQEEWFYEYYQQLRLYQQQEQTQPGQRYSRQEAFALFCCGTQYLKVMGLIKERRRQQRTVATAGRAALAGGGQQAESATTTTINSGIVYDKISLVFCGGND